MNLTIFPANKNGEQIVAIRSHDYTTHFINTKKKNVDEFISQKDKLQKQTYGICTAAMAVGVGLIHLIDKKVKNGNDALGFAAALIPTVSAAFYIGTKNAKLAKEFIDKAQKENNIEEIA